MNLRLATDTEHKYVTLKALFVSITSSGLQLHSLIRPELII